jgi:hypothetical protein
MRNQNVLKALARASSRPAAILFFFVILTWLDIYVLGAESRKESDFMPLEAIETKVVDSYLIGVVGSPAGQACSTNNTSTDDPLVYVIWTTGTPAWVAYPAEPEYAYQVELLDTNGVAMRKTELGKKFGTEFYDFGPRTKVRRCPTAKKGEAVPMNYLFSHPEGLSVPFHPESPSNIFTITNAGRYTLRIRFQIMTFPRTGPKRSDYTNKLVRFPPLDYPVFKATNALLNPLPRAQTIRGVRP